MMYRYEEELSENSCWYLDVKLVYHFAIELNHVAGCRRNSPAPCHLRRRASASATAASNDVVGAICFLEIMPNVYHNFIEGNHFFLQESHNQLATAKN
jgi:hypothetical protein